MHKLMPTFHNAWSRIKRHEQDRQKFALFIQFDQFFDHFLTIAAILPEQADRHD